MVSSETSAYFGGIASAVHASKPPRHSLISLNLQKIAHFGPMIAFIEAVNWA
jgi:hypothetical protein